MLLRTGTARQILELLIARTSYRIRILTKNAIVGTPDWVQFFSAHADRFVVGLSIGTLDDKFGRSMEWRTSSPTARIKALQSLQQGGVPTYGMLCPVFPQVLETDELERLLDGIQPSVCEHVWAEPFNDRQNWKVVRDVSEAESWGWNWMTEVYERKRHAVWSRYATRLYQRIHEKAVAEGWSDKLRYLLYEDQITAEDAPAFQELDGVLLQCNPGQDGRSPHPYFANLPAAS